MGLPRAFSDRQEGRRLVLGLSVANPRCCGGDSRPGRPDRWTRGFHYQQLAWGSTLPPGCNHGGQTSDEWDPEKKREHSSLRRYETDVTLPACQGNLNIYSYRHVPSLGKRQTERGVTFSSDSTFLM